MTISILRDSGKQIVRWVCRGLQDNPDDYGTDCFALGFVEQGRLIGGLIFHGISQRELWWSIYTTTPLWCNKRVLRFCFDLAFNVLGVRRINLLISTSNVQSLSFCTRLGFQIEGIKRQARDNGEDAFCLGMLKSECKFINKGERK